LLQNGVAAFERGEGNEARRLLQAAIDGGAPSEEALAVLDRLNRFEAAAAPAVSSPRSDRARRERAPLDAGARPRSAGRLLTAALLIVAVAASAVIAVA